MPIRINLLAEAIAEEEQRRKDPVKRAIAVGLLLGLGMLVWCSSLQLKSMLAKSELGRLETEINLRTNEFAQATENNRKLADVNLKLESLQRLGSTRLLCGTLLDALQQTVIPDVRLMRMRLEQSYILAEGTKAKTNADRIIPGKLPTSTEQIVLTLEAKDSAPNPGDQVNKFKKAVEDSPYFRNVLGKTNEVRLTSLSPPQPSILFTLQCRYPEHTR